LELETPLDEVKSPPSKFPIMAGKKSITSDQLQPIKQHSAITHENVLSKSSSSSSKPTNQLSSIQKQCKSTTTITTTTTTITTTTTMSPKVRL